MSEMLVFGSLLCERIKLQSCYTTGLESALAVCLFSFVICVPHMFRVFCERPLIGGVYECTVFTFPCFH